MITSQLKNFCNSLPSYFDDISSERKAILKKIANYIQHHKDNSLDINLVYICTHNSRRSHFGQVWAAVASYYYGIKNVYSFSGGTEVTAFNTNAIQALQRIGFVVKTDSVKENPTYKVYFKNENYVECFSKCYNDAINPKNNFVAIMTCDSAETQCPFIPNCDLRIATTYHDPKASDNTPQQDETYDHRCKEIAVEIFYMFSLIQ